MAIAVAAPAAAEEPQLGPTIVVTGERVPRALTETASSIAVLTEEAIAKLPRADRLDQLLLATPNVQIGTGSEGPAIRGQDSTGPLQQLGAFLGGTRPRVTLQVDGRPLGYNEFVFASSPLWDVRQVEIFRSPQTTTQGRNSIAGAIFIETNDPAMALAGAARVQLGDNRFRQLSAMANAPLVDGQLAVRVAGDIRRGQPSSTYVRGTVDGEVDRDDFSLLRAKLLATPAKLPNLGILVTYVHSHSFRPQYLSAADPPYEARAVPRSERTNGVLEINADTLTARVDLELSPRTAWRTLIAYGDVEVRRFGQPGLGRNRVWSREWFVESRLAFAPAEGREGVVGVSWLGQDQYQVTDLTGVPLGTGSFDDWQASFGLFGETTVRPVADVALTLGLRYQRDRQDRQGETVPRPPGATISYGETFEAWLPKLVLSWSPTPGIATGILVQRAYNPGGTSLTLSTRKQTDFAAETLWNTELFARAVGRRALDS
jgi:outer membrane receptor protein involved in Fe transport